MNYLYENNKKIKKHVVLDRMNYILLPSSGEDSQERFKSSIANGIPLEKIKDKLPADVVKTLSESKSIAWGFIDSSKNNNNKWQKLENGDIVVFYRQKRLFYRGKICGKIIDHDLAVSLWGHDSNGLTWDLVFFINEMESIDYPWVPELMGYKSNCFPQSANIFKPYSIQYNGLKKMIHDE